MPAQVERIQEFRDFLMDAFDIKDFHQFLVLSGYKEVADTLNRDVGKSEYFFCVAEEMDKRGLIDARFFELVRQERQTRNSEITALERS